MLTIASTIFQEVLNGCHDSLSQDELKLFLEKHIFDQASLLKTSLWLGVTPTTLRKVLSGRTMSRYIFKKLSHRIEQRKSPEDTFLQSPKIQRILSVYRLYQERGTLSKAGKKMGLTRERVRQLLRSGEELGLFEYKKPSKIPLLAITIPKEKLIEDYRNLLQFRLVAKNNGISVHQFYQLVKYYQMTRRELKATRFQGHQLKSILQYYSFVRKKGGHLSTTELQNTAEGRYLSFKITKLWGSIHTFRKELKIPFRKSIPPFRHKIL